MQRQRNGLTIHTQRPGKEIEFIVVKNQKPRFAVECKTDDRQLSKQISYYAERTNISHFFQVHFGSKDYEIKVHRARVLPFRKLSQWLMENSPSFNHYILR